MYIHITLVDRSVQFRLLAKIGTKPKHRRTLHALIQWAYNKIYQFFDTETAHLHLHSTGQNSKTLITVDKRGSKPIETRFPLQIVAIGYNLQSKTVSLESPFE